MTDKLSIFNKAATHLEERRLVDLNEKRELKRVLDSLWPDAPLYCLGQGLFRFAKRVVQIEASASITPAFGYNFAFPIPDDWIRTVVVSASPQLDPPLLQYSEEGSYWFANASPLFVSFISNDPAYGMELSRWPQSFSEYVAYRLAQQAARRISGKEELADGLEKKELRQKRNAKGLDAMNDPPGLPPVPFLVCARRGAFGPGGFSFGSGGSGNN